MLVIAKKGENGGLGWMVQARTRIMNQPQAVALNKGLRCKKRLWRDAGREQLVVSVSPVGGPASARPTGVAGPPGFSDRGTDASHRAGSREMS